MGVYTMRCSLNASVPVMMVAAAATMLAQSPNFKLGAPLSQDEIRGFDMMVGPEGKELPPGKGTAKEGAEIFAKQCAVCHGKNGSGGPANRLVLGSPGNPHRGPWKDTEKSATSYYPYPTIAWDYIHRAMPATKPGSLSPDEVYALVAFLFYQNGIIQEGDVMDAKSLPKVQMPNRDGFVPAKPVWPPEKKPSWY
jgi:mono/diheme cytochrome c family protein